MRSKIFFRLYQIDKSLPDDVIDGYLSLENLEKMDILPEIYRFVWKSLEDTDLDLLYSKYTKDDRPNNYVARSLDVSDVVEIVDEQGISIFYILDNFGWTVIDFDKSLVPSEMGFKQWYINTDFETRRELSMDIKGKAVIQIMVQRLRKSSKTVTTLFRRSKSYEKLHDEKTGLWAESPYLIADEFEKEIKENIV